MKPLTIMDEVYTFDLPASPINIPAFIIFKKPDEEKWGSPEE